MTPPKNYKRTTQLKFLKDSPKAYGGELLKKREGRAHGRPLDTKNTMHLVLRSTKAVGNWSFWKPKNKELIKSIIHKFSQKYGVKILSMANVGNHLHFHIKLSNRHTYRPFIRAITAAIAMGVTGTNRWSVVDSRSDSKFTTQKEALESTKAESNKTKRLKFWDYRPYTRVAIGFRSYLRLRDYIKINQLEGFGFQKPQARFFLAWENLKFRPNSS